MQATTLFPSWARRCCGRVEMGLIPAVAKSLDKLTSILSAGDRCLYLGVRQCLCRLVSLNKKIYSMIQLGKW